MTRVTQPPGSHLCGQAVVAMLAGISLERSIELMGTRGRTHTHQMVAALREKGHEARRGMLVRGRWRDPSIGRGFGRVRCKGDRRFSHWFAFEKGRVFDSWYQNAPRDWPERWQVTVEFVVRRAA